MFRVFLASLLAMVFSLPAPAGIQSFPSDFKTKDIQTEGATIHVRMGGQGPAVIMLHGFADTGDMWAPLAAELARDLMSDALRKSSDNASSSARRTQNTTCVT